MKADCLDESLKIVSGQTNNEIADRIHADFIDNPDGVDNGGQRLYVARIFKDRSASDTGVASSDERFRAAEQRFRAPRFRCLYRAWRRRGDAVIWPTVSNTLVDKMDHGDAVLRCEPVTGSYMHLDDLVGKA